MDRLSWRIGLKKTCNKEYEYIEFAFASSILLLVVHTKFNPHPICTRARTFIFFPSKSKNRINEQCKLKHYYCTVLAKGKI